MQAIYRLVQIGDSPSDSEIQKQKHHFMILMGLIMGMGGLVWGTLAMVFGLAAASTIPFGYTFVTVVNFLFFAKTKKFKLSSFIQVFMSLALPFFFQWSLGGYVSSGMVMLWSILALIGSLAFYDTKASRIWIILFIGLTILSYVIDPYLANIAVNISDSASRLFFMLNGVIVSTAVYFLVVFFINIRNEANVELEEKNEEIELQQEILMHRTKSVMDSIAYAKKIQTAVLPSQERFNAVISESFILFKPKDIVSGDFYWLKENKEATKFYLGLADCTGHGVPGAFMSILMSSLLERAIRSTEFQYSPERVLTYVRLKLIETLKQKQNKGKDGMDISLFCFDKEKYMLSFSGAYMSLFILRKGGEPLRNMDGTEYEAKTTSEDSKLYVIKGTKTPIGFYYGKAKEFKLNQIQIQKGDLVYLTSDGYVDQFGGDNPKENKLSPKRFRQEIMNNSALPVSEQGELLEKMFNDWRGSSEQTDDVCVIGVKF